MILSCSAFAGSYKVQHNGSSIADVANKLGVSEKAILEANGFSKHHKLRKGEVLIIPSSKTSSHHSVSVNKSAGAYVIQNGDCDWTVAHKFHLTVPQLKALNPGVDLASLTIGHKLRVPGEGGGSSQKTHEVAKATHAGGTYTVKEDDNDWIIAKNVGTTPHILRQLNPGLKWGSIQPGQKIRIPGHASQEVAAHFPMIRSRHAVIAKDQVVLRRGPSTDSDKILTVDAGTRVAVLDREGHWYKLRFPKGTEAWVRGDNLKPVVVEEVAERHHSSRVARHEETREERKHNARLAYLEHLERLQRHNERAQHLAMRHGRHYAENRARSARESANMPDYDSDVVHDALAMRGVRYQWGAMSRGATDCSGLVGQVYRRHGVKLPRTSVEQSKVGQNVGKSELKEGDLVFFRTRGSGRVSHVGMYIGGGKFVHASSGGGQVQVNSLSDSYYSKRFAGARRVAKHLSGGHAKQHVAKNDDAPIKDEDGD